MLEDLSAYAVLPFEERTIDWALAHAWDEPIPAASRDTVVGEFTIGQGALDTPPVRC